MNIYESTSDADGSCNECRRTSGRGYKVTVVSVNRVTIQLCDSCLSILRKGLSIHAKESKGRAKK